MSGNRRDCPLMRNCQPAHPTTVATCRRNLSMRLAESPPTLHSRCLLAFGLLCAVGLVLSVSLAMASRQPSQGQDLNPSGPT